MDSSGAGFGLNSGDFALNSDDLDKITQSLLAEPPSGSGTQMSGTGYNSLGSFPSINTSKPFIEIIEQPKSRGLRFRYECEGRNAGSIPGESTSPSEKTYPTIQIHNHTGSAVVVVSCVTKEDPAKPHPHALVGKDCGEGVCTVKTKRANLPLSFPGIGIQCAKKKDLLKQLEKREAIRVDPFQTGFEHKNGPLDLTVVRLCFQAFLPDSNGKFTEILAPIVSKPIYDKKAINELNICRCSSYAGSVKGGEEVFLFTDKVNKDDIQVHFYEEDRDGVSWEAFGKFGAPDVHKQVAMVFKTPPYKNQNIESPVKVFMELKRPSDGITSNPLPYTYIPSSIEASSAKRKRKYVNEDLKNQFIQDASGNCITPPSPKSQLKQQILQRKAQEAIVKQEVPTPADQAVQYWPVGHQGQGDYTTYSSVQGYQQAPGNDEVYVQEYMTTSNDPNLPPMKSFLEDISSGDLPFNSGDLYGVAANEDVMSSDNMPEDLANLHKQLRSIQQ